VVLALQGQMEYDLYSIKSGSSIKYVEPLNLMYGIEGIVAGF